LSWRKTEEPVLNGVARDVHQLARNVHQRAPLVGSRLLISTRNGGGIFTAAADCTRDLDGRRAVLILEGAGVHRDAHHRRASPRWPGLMEIPAPMP